MKKTLKLQGKAVYYHLIFKNKKTLSIKICKENELLISAPEFLSEDEVINLVAKKEKWIIENLCKFSISKNVNSNNKYKNEEEFLYLGSIYKLNVNKIHTGEECVFIQGDTIIINIQNEEEIKVLLHKWYRAEALKILGERACYYSKIIGLKPSKIIVKEQKSRWGSCNIKKEIRLNWRLTMAPLDVIDYVVIHELCHIAYMNHSVEYWNYVSNIMSDHKEKRRWLKDNGIMLMSALR